jgi:hypothetical protein
MSSSTSSTSNHNDDSSKAESKTSENKHVEGDWLALPLTKVAEDTVNPIRLIVDRVSPSPFVCASLALKSLRHSSFSQNVSCLHRTSIHSRSHLFDLQIKIPESTPSKQLINVTIGDPTSIDSILFRACISLFLIILSVLVLVSLRQSESSQIRR